MSQWVGFTQLAYSAQAIHAKARAVLIMHHVFKSQKMVVQMLVGHLMELVSPVRLCLASLQAHAASAVIVVMKSVLQQSAFFLMVTF